MTTAAALVSDEQVAAFRRDGFVVVPGLLTDDELRAYGQEVDAAMAARKKHDNRALSEKTRYEQSFIQCQNLWEDFSGVRPLTLATTRTLSPTW